MSSIVFAPNAVANYNSAAVDIKRHLDAALAAPPKSAARRKAKALAYTAVEALYAAVESGAAAPSLNGAAYFSESTLVALGDLASALTIGNRVPLTADNDGYNAKDLYDEVFN